MAIARKELETGVHERPKGKHNPRILQYRATTTLRATADEVPWCSSFVNSCMEQAGVKGTKSAAARSWLNWTDGQKLTDPAPGCVVVFSRGSNPAHGHVALYVRERGNDIIVLGGNQGNEVSEKAYPKGRLLGYRWPKGSPTTFAAEEAAAPTPTTGRDWPNLDPAERNFVAMDALIRRYGYSVNAAAGIVGNLIKESGVIPSRIEGSRSETPMRSRGVDEKTHNWTPQQIMNRDFKAKRGPKLPGVGLAQWTWKTRRSGLFEHRYQGKTLGPNILFDIDAQIDYLVTELQRDYPGVEQMLRRQDVTMEAAADKFVMDFERPAATQDPSTRQRELTDRRKKAAKALGDYRSFQQKA